MYRSIRKHSDRIAATLGVACALALLPVPGFALDTDDTRSVTIRYSDLDLDTPSGASALYSRLVRAARDVCGDPVSVIDISQMRSIQSCRKDTLANAVVCIDHPMLTAVYDSLHPDQLLAGLPTRSGPVSSSTS
jgi:UrcA family protein